MNQSIIENINAAATTASVSREESLLTRILSSLSKIAKYLSVDGKQQYQHQSFIEQNLLDKNLGDEIQRCMR